MSENTTNGVVSINKLRGPVGQCLSGGFRNGEFGSFDDALDHVVLKFGDRVTNHDVLRSWLIDYCTKHRKFGYEPTPEAALAKAKAPVNLKQLAAVSDMNVAAADLLSVANLIAQLGGREQLERLCELTEEIQRIGGRDAVLKIATLVECVQDQASLPQIVEVLPQVLNLRKSELHSCNGSSQHGTE